MPSAEDFAHDPRRTSPYRDEPISELDESRDIFNTFVAAVADLLGLSSLSSLDEFGYADLNYIKAELKRLRNELMMVYNKYPERTTFLTKENMTLGDFEQLLKAAMNEQSDFSKWALSYSPVSTAYRKFHEHADQLARKVNEITVRSSDAESQYQDEVNKQASKQTKVANLIQGLDALDNDISELRNTTALEKTNKSFQDLADQTRDEAAKVITQVKTYENENRN